MEAIDKIRIGNTIEVFLPVLTNGEEVSLVGRNISVKLFTPRGGSQKIEGVCIDADVTNVVKFVVEGTAQQYTGKYRAVVYENANRASQALFDKVAFELVHESAMEDYGGTALAQQGVEGLQTLEAALAERFGARFFNWRKYLSEEGLDVEGLVPTSADNTAMEEGKCPPSLLADEVHPNDYGHDAIARRLFAMMDALGYLE